MAIWMELNRSIFNEWRKESIIKMDNLVRNQEVRYKIASIEKSARIVLAKVKSQIDLDEKYKTVEFEAGNL